MTNLQVLLADRNQTVADIATFYRAHGLRQSESWISRLVAGARPGSDAEMKAIAEFAGVSEELAGWLVSRAVPVIPQMALVGASA